MRKMGNGDKEDRLVKKAVVAGQFIKEEDYWKNKLAGEITKSFFPYDYKQDSISKHNKEEFRFKITGELYAKLMKLRNGVDARLHMILVTGIVILLNKMTGNTDIIIGSPSLKQDVDVKFINTVLVLRHIIHDNMSFKELLLEVRKTIIEAAENQNFPIETLPYRLNMPISPGDDFPLFEIALLLENIHDKRYIDHINLNLLFSFIRSDECIEGVVEFNSSLYNRMTIERIVGFYKQVFHTAFADIGIRISEICILTEQERQKILFDFNDSNQPFPENQTLHQLFEEQAARAPDGVSVVGSWQLAVGKKERSEEPVQLTYKELNEKSNRLAWRLRDKGVKADTLVGIMVESSIELIIGILGILKAGGAYLPIDPGYPEKRKKYILTDGGVKLLLGQKRYIDRIEKDIDNYDAIDFTLEAGYTGMRENVAPTCFAHNLAYGIYTSGTTGKPNGVLVEHRNIVNYACWRIEKFNYTENDSSCQMISLSFDAFGTNFYPGILTGGKIVLADSYRLLDGDYIRNLIKREKITNFSIVPPVYKLILENAGGRELETVRFVVLGGEKASDDLIALSKNIFPGIEIINEYGPTECTVASAACRDVTPGKISIIGEPIFNTSLYILDGMNRLQPVGVAGELCIAGAGLARGYLNNPELTAERFIYRSYRSYSLNFSKKIYKTGDLARWLPNGNIEFLGRSDQQVKIRGFRIELGEIESQLLNHDEIKDAVVLDRLDEQGQKYLCAYIVGVNGFSEMLDSIKLKEYLTDRHPDYMIPSSFVILDKIPLKTNGKVDRKALPEPEITAAEDYVAPRSSIEKKLLDIWADVLNIQKEVISIHTNFFEIGGHSLKATILTSKIHKEFNIQLPLAVLFEKPTVAGLAGYIKNSGPDEYTTVEPAEKKEYYKLSSPQKRLYILQQIDLDSTGYNIPETIYLDKDIDGDRLERTFRELIKRHESLRTSFEMINDEPVQRIYPDVPFAVEYYPLHAGGSPGAGEDAAGKIVARFVRPFDLEKAPLMRVGLINTGETGHVLILDMHHVISDGASMQVFIKDFADLYQGEELPRLRIQYKDYAHWQNSEKEKAAIKIQEDYWVSVFADGTPQLNLPLDYPRPEQQSFEGKSIDFQVGEQETGELKKIASAGEATLYMVLLALYTVMLAKVSGQEDIVVGTPTAGRKHADLENIIGMFVNTLALRNFPSGDKPFNAHVAEVKQRTLSAFDNQDYPFEDLVDKLDILRNINRNPLFDVMFTLHNLEIQELEIPGLKLTPYTHEAGTAKFDLTLTAFEKEKKIHFVFRYCTKLFRDDTISRFIRYFKKIISSVILEPGRKISGIEISPEEERKSLLNEFNDTQTSYPKEKTLHQLFEDRVEKAPDNIALIHSARQISFRQLNGQANRLARLLESKGIDTETAVAIMSEPCCEMIVGILAVSKCRAFYLPIDPAAPRGRIDYSLRDSEAKFFLTHPPFPDHVDAHVETLNIKDENLYKTGCGNRSGDPGNTIPTVSPSAPVYMIYTSGTTGTPKGVMVTHQNLVNYIHWFSSEARLTDTDKTCLTSSFTFDLGYTAIFPALSNGARLHMLPRDTYMDPELMSNYIQRHGITYLKMTPSQFSTIVASRCFSADTFRGLRLVVLGGEAINTLDVEKAYRICSGLRIMNHYGPTEVTIGCIAQFIERGGLEAFKIKPAIGRPIFNSNVYILDKYLNVLPMGIAGELCLAGDGVTRGYLNHPELTNQRFFFRRPGIFERLYHTGDSGRWLPGGSIEFLGRIDQQVKIRGFRVEPEEIENRLSNHPGIKEAVVSVHEEENGSKNLCAYIVPGYEIPESSIKEYLSTYLPDYMIPLFYVFLEKIPLTPNGKIDRRALPKPDLKPGSSYVAPGNKWEEKLVEIWSQVLELEKDIIGIDSNFFQLGGHSLKIAAMTARIHRELEVNVPMVQVFKTPTIRGLSGCIKTMARDKYASIEPVEEREFYELSSAQKRLYVLQQFNPASTAYNMPRLITLEPGIKREPLNRAFDRLIKRHESLRTSFHIITDEPVQRIHENVEFEIEYYDLAAWNREEERQPAAAFIRSFIRPFALTKAPLLRVGLVKQQEGQHLLFVDMHHIISDGISNQVLIKEFMSLYKGKELPPLRLQYKDYSEWQGSEKQKKEKNRQEKFWLKEYENELPVLNLPTDFDRPPIQSFEGSTLSFKLDKEETNALKTLVLEEEATLYMTLLAIYFVFLGKLSGQADILVGTPIESRKYMDLKNIIGMFVGTLVLRNYPEGEKTFRYFLGEVKERTLKAFENQDYPFEDLKAKVNVHNDPSRNPMFDVSFQFWHVEAGGGSNPEVKLSGLKDDPYQYEYTTSKFDLYLKGAEVGENLILYMEYCTKLFKEETIKNFIKYYKEIVLAVIRDRDIKLKDIKISHDLLDSHSTIPQMDFGF